eukprot:jgi/Ulvmu1/8003/UM004_0239.1
MELNVLLAYYKLDALDSVEQRLLVDDQNISAQRAAYLQKVVQGIHVVGRDFAYISGSMYNRRCFIRLAKEALLSCESIGPVSIGDLQSILQLICPNFPLGVVKNAFTPARSLTTVQPSSPNAATSPAVYWRCLQVTLMYEASLMAIRKACFDKDKSCKDIKTLRRRLECADTSCKHQRIPEQHLQCAISAMDGGHCTFGELLRNLCGNDDLHQQLDAECSKPALPSWPLSVHLKEESASLAL